MNVSCLECSSIFRVDPAKIPPAGVRARCSVCGGVIALAAPARSGEPLGIATAPAVARSTPAVSIAAAPSPVPPAPSAPPAPAAPRSSPTPAPARPGSAFTPPLAGAFASASAPPGVPGVPPNVARVSQEPSLSPPPAPAPIPSLRPARSLAAPVPAPDVPRPRPPINPFLANDPNQRAKRLARALVSDIVAYFPAKHKEGVRDGTLKELFREEIRKSYEEYLGQIGKEFAESTTHFQDALNDVLAGGKKVF